MLKQTEGSHAVAEAIALCRPQVICAYPNSPQTHLDEALGRLVDSGSLAPCEFINVESEFAALSVAIVAATASFSASDIARPAALIATSARDQRQDSVSRIVLPLACSLRFGAAQRGSSLRAMP